MEEVVGLEDLVGKHVLTGVDFETGKVPDDWERRDCQAINFVLDGETYTATEDPTDGYRSCMKDVRKSNVTVKNTFEPCKVEGKMQEGENDVIDFTDSVTGKVVLSVGTDHTDNYYPWFVSEFTPENMAINRKTNRERQTSVVDPSPRQSRKNSTNPTSTPTVRRKRQLP